MTAVKELEKVEEETTTPEAKMSGVVKVIEVIGTSKTSFDDAIATAIKTAARSLRHLSGADVKHMTVAVAEGMVTEYRVALKVAFALDADDDDDDDD